MKIGEKIIALRIKSKLSQANLAKKLNVSRQSISKWESNESYPSLDKIIELCNLFKITCDDLLKGNIVPEDKVMETKPLSGKPKYFGTDGFRGEVNVKLTADHAYKIGRFLGWYYSKHTNKQPRILIGKDTRRSSYMYEYAIAAGVSASGADASLLHVTTSPSIAYVVRQDEFNCGVMITASHNPYYDNGIKIINNKGEKIDDSVALLIEAYIDGNLKALGVKGNDLPLAAKEHVGTITDYYSGRNRYIAYLISLAKHSMRSLKIGLDTANGCSYMIAKSVFEALGAQITIINNTPDGTNINRNAGSTHIEGLCKLVKDNNLDLGFAFDGDADRCIAVDEKGHVVDGDKIIYLLAMKLKEENALTNNTVVTTIMSNSGLVKALKKEKINNIQTNVGDRFVYEKMQEGNFALGGEQSGHIIIRKYASTGDGILTAIMVTEEVLKSKLTLSKLVEPVKLLPQKTVSVRVTNQKAVLDDEVVMKEYNKINDAISDNGRILLRKSGTEPVIRIMVERPTIKDCDYYINLMYKVIRKRGYACE